MWRPLALRNAETFESVNVTFPGRNGDFFFIPTGSEPFREEFRAEHVFVSGIASEKKAERGVH